MSSALRTESNRPAVTNRNRAGKKANAAQAYVARIAKQLAKSGMLADILNGGQDVHAKLRHVAPEVREELIKIARAVRYALLQGGDAGLGSRA
ncbi:hypothetical protein VVD49_01735 [Uliginosibacterium sp. H3]|uniref:Uncharacterized protein n=1 Tax=Uliginosibacterium silvisoli TaxID=3114758 RepID=A0ABU6JXQ5_9RHOO|nr:hypothetical protein [Uliginosibacterium sp. H3]